MGVTEWAHFTLMDDASKSIYFIQMIGAINGAPFTRRKGC
jgi:hypothetical protein